MCFSFYMAWLLVFFIVLPLIIMLIETGYFLSRQVIVRIPVSEPPMLRPGKDFPLLYDLSRNCLPGSC